MAFKTILLGLLAACLPLTGPSAMRDPTQPSYPAQMETPVSGESGPLRLSAIMITSQTRRATINGVAAKAGQTILNGVRVLRIRHNSVIVEHNGVTKTLHLVSRPYKTSINSSRRP